MSKSLLAATSTQKPTVYQQPPGTEPIFPATGGNSADTITSQQGNLLVLEAGRMTLEMGSSTCSLPRLSICIIWQVQVAGDLKREFFRLDDRSRNPLQGPQLDHSLNPDFYLFLV